MSQEEYDKRQLRKRLYYNENKDKLISQSTAWKRQNRDRVHVSMLRCRQKIKLETMSHYSGTNLPQCANPFAQHEEPYTDIRALTLDLIAGGHRSKGFPYGEMLYHRLQKEQYPEGWQVLCGNCQMIKKSENKE